jgi:hypothetical protein
MRKIILGLLLVCSIGFCSAADSEDFEKNFYNKEKSLMNRYIKTIPKKYGLQSLGFNYGFDNEGIFNGFTIRINGKFNLESHPLPEFKKITSVLYEHFYSEYPDRIFSIEIIFQHLCGENSNCPGGQIEIYKTKTTNKLFKSGLEVIEYVFPDLDPIWNHPPADYPYG